MPSLAGKTLLVTGASRGIGLAIALRAAHDGANVALAAKTAEPHPKLPGTIHTAAAEVEAAGGRALPLQLDVRDDEAVAAAVRQTAEHFGGVDVVVNNASAIFLAPTEHTPMRRFDLMFGVNVRATFAVTQACLPHLKASAEAGRNPHVLTLSPPPSLEPRWYAPHLAYTMSKMGMSLCVLGWAEELSHYGIAANALWPVTTISTAAIQNLLGGDEMMRHSRTPAVVADAAHHILTRPAREVTGRFYTDEEALAEAGVTDLSSYSVTPGAELVPDFFL